MIPLAVPLYISYIWIGNVTHPPIGHGMVLMAKIVPRRVYSGLRTQSACMEGVTMGQDCFSNGIIYRFVRERMTTRIMLREGYLFVTSTAM